MDTSEALKDDGPPELTPNSPSVQFLPADSSDTLVEPLLAALVADGTIPSAKADFLLSKFAKLQEAAAQSAARERRLLTEARDLAGQLAAQQQEADGRAADCARVQRQATALQIEYGRFEGLLALAQERHAALEAEQSLLETERGRLRGALAAVEDEARARLIPQIEEAQTEIGELDASIAQYRTQQAALRAKHIELDQAIVVNEAARKDAASVAAAVQARVAELARMPGVVSRQAALVMANVNSLEEALTRAREEAQTAARKVKAAQERADAAERVLANENARATKERNAANASTTAVSNLRSRLENARAESEAAKNEYSHSEMLIKRAQSTENDLNDAVRRAELALTAQGRITKKIELAVARDRDTLAELTATASSLSTDAVAAANAREQARRELRVAEDSAVVAAAAAARELERASLANSAVVEVEKQVAEVRSNVIAASKSTSTLRSTLTSAQLERTAAVVAQRELRAQATAAAATLSRLDNEALALARRLKTAQKMTMEFAGLYEETKRQRAAAAAAADAAAAAVASVRKDLDLARAEVGEIVIEVEARGEAVGIERRARTRATDTEQRLRSEVANARAEVAQTDARIGDGLVKNEQLRAEQMSNEAAVQQLEQEEAAAERTLTLAKKQLERETEALEAEAATLKALETAVDNGNRALDLSETHITMLKQRCRDIERLIGHANKAAQPAAQVEEQRASLECDLDQVKMEVRLIAAQLADPGVRAWRALPDKPAADGQGDDKGLLRRRCVALEEELVRKKKIVLERQLVLEELRSMGERMRVGARASRQAAAASSQAVAETQGRLITVERRLRAAAAELSLLQADGLDLRERHDELTAIVETARLRDAAGLAPTDDADAGYARLQRTLAVRAQIAAERGEREERAAELASLPDGAVLTTAPVRPDSYIPDVPDGLGLAVPYGAFPPARPTPTQAGAAARFAPKATLRRREALKPKLIPS